MIDLLSSFQDFGYLNLIAILGIFLIGMPHGSFDGAIAMHLGIANKPSKFVTFLVSYVLLSAVVVATWILLPALTLILFLLISAFHFGSRDSIIEEKGIKLIESITLGGIVIVAISQFHRTEVDAIYSYLINGNTAVVWAIIDVLTLGVILGFMECLTINSGGERWRKKAIEVGVLLAIFAVVPPLVGFSIYFCLVHSSRHFKEIYSTLSESVGKKNIQLQALGLTALTWIFGLTAFYFLADVTDPGPAILRVTFIGLAALTVPHMILVDGLYSRKESVS